MVRSLLLAFLLAAGSAILIKGVDFTKLPLPCLLPIVDVDPAKYPVPAPWTGEFAKNTRLRRSKRLFEGQIKGSESIAVSRNGTVYLLDGSGYLKVAHGSTRQPLDITIDAQPQAYLGPGRPLGFHLDGDDDLYICNSLLGLTRLPDGARAQQLLANSVPGAAPGSFSPIAYADDLDILLGGDVVFSDASAIPPALGRAGRYDTMRSYMLTVLQGAPSGRLLRWHAGSGETSTLADGLWFPNGVALAADGSFVVVAETVTARILKHWLAGPKAGTTEILVHSLPGYPDGVSRAPDGNFWVALITDHLPVINWSVRLRSVRWALAWLSHFLPVPIKHMGAALKISPEGKVLDLLVDPDAHVIGSITSVVERDGWLYMGSLTNDFIGVLDLSKAS